MPDLEVIEGPGAPVRVVWTTTGAPVGEAQWRDLAHGIRVKLRPMSGLASAAIQAGFARQLRDLSLGVDVLNRFGFDAADAVILSKPEVAHSFGELTFNAVRAVVLIEDWNLADPDGEPIPITTASVARLFTTGVEPGTGSTLMAAFEALVDGG